MKKQVILILALVLIGLTASTNYAQTREVALTEADYTDWLFVQGDKALQRRFAVAKKEGSVSYLQLQFRVKSDDEIHCRGAQCDGYVLYMSHDNIARTGTLSYNLYFEPSFVGDKVYNFTELIPVELKTWEDGAKRYIDKQRGIVVSYPNGEVVNAKYFYECVDFKLKDAKHRCDDFDMSKAVRVSESNVVLTNTESQREVQPSTDTQSEASKILAERKLAKQKEQDAINEERQKREKVNQPLVEGIRENYLDVVKLALKEGANAKSIDSSTMKIAISNGNEEMLRTLISAGANPNQVFMACYGFELTCSEDFRLFLIEAGANVNQVTYLKEGGYSIGDESVRFIKSYTPLLLEIEEFKSLPVVRALIKANANINYKLEKFEETPLFLAVRSSPCNLEIIKLLVESGAIVNHSQKDVEGRPFQSIVDEAKNNCKPALPILKAKR